MGADVQGAIGEHRTRAGWRGRLGIAWLVVLFLVSIPAVTPRLYASDEIQYFAYLRSLWFDRDLSFENEYRYFYDRGIARAYDFHRTFLELETETGRRINFGTIGCALLWAPFYGLADLVARTLRAAGAPVVVDGFSSPYLMAVAYGSAVYGWLAVVLSTLVARRLVGRRSAAVAAALAIWLGTPLLFYMYVAPGMAHACSAFAVAVFVWTWLRVRARWSPGGVAGLGALAALMGMVREQDLLLAAGPLVDRTWSWVHSRRGAEPRAHGRVAWAALAGAVAFAAAYLPQLLAYRTLYGRVGPSPLVEAKMKWWAPHAVAVLVSPQHGLFVWTPVVILSLVGLVLLIARDGRAEEPAAYERQVVWCLLLMFGTQVYISGSVDTWTLAGAFGQRRFVGTTVLLVVGLTGLWAAARSAWARRATVGAAALGVWWNLGLTAQFGAGLMDRQRLEPLQNAYTTFVVIPRMAPELAYRYLFDRASFYQQPERYRQPR